MVKKIPVISEWTKSEKEARKTNDLLEWQFKDYEDDTDHENYYIDVSHNNKLHSKIITWGCKCCCMEVAQYADYKLPKNVLEHINTFYVEISEEDDFIKKIIKKV